MKLCAFLLECCSIGIHFLQHPVFGGDIAGSFDTPWFTLVSFPRNQYIFQYGTASILVHFSSVLYAYAPGESSAVSHLQQHRTGEDFDIHPVHGMAACLG